MTEQPPGTRLDLSGRAGPRIRVLPQRLHRRKGFHIVGPSAAEVRRWRLVRPVSGKRWASVAVVLMALLACAAVLRAVDWRLAAQVLAGPAILRGLADTALLAAGATVLGTALGLLAAWMQRSTELVLRAAAAAYVCLFRSTPVLLQLLLWSALPRLLPAGNGQDASVAPFMAALLGIGFYQGARAAATLGAGLQAVDAGQFEAARSLGMTRGRALRRIILPQLLRMAGPTLARQFVGIVKLTSLASVLGVSVLLRGTQSAQPDQGPVLEMLLAAAVWYGLAVAVLSRVPPLLERRLAQAGGGGQPPGWL